MPSPKDQRPDIPKKYHDLYYETVGGKRVTRRGALRRIFKYMAFDAYGWECACCGETDPRFLTIDHPNNDGAEFRRQYSKEGKDAYRVYKSLGYPPGLQTLCWQCNMGKSVNHGICPHKDPVPPPSFSEE